jgi:hypothetical protein
MRRREDEGEEEDDEDFDERRRAMNIPFVKKTTTAGPRQSAS